MEKIFHLPAKEDRGEVCGTHQVIPDTGDAQSWIRIKGGCLWSGGVLLWSSRVCVLRPAYQAELCWYMDNCSLCTGRNGNRVGMACNIVEIKHGLLPASRPRNGVKGGRYLYELLVSSPMPVM
jgi:hypothetical protein